MVEDSICYKKQSPWYNSGYISALLIVLGNSVLCCAFCICYIWDSRKINRTGISTRDNQWSTRTKTTE